VKVVQVASSLYEWGGIERYVSFVSQGLRERGHEVMIARASSSRLAEREAGTDIALRQKLDLRAFAQYLRLFSSFRPDVVHVHFSPDFIVAGLAAKARKVPLRVMTRHVALPWSARKVRMYLSLWPSVIPVSNAAQTVLKESGVPEHQMIVAKAGLPKPGFTKSRAAVREELGMPQSSFLAGSFSRLTKEKGIDVLLRAMPRAQGIEALVYGDGAYGEELAKLNSLMRVANQVHFIGRVDDVPNHMAAMDVVVIPSTWVEAFPYAALEALAVGTPVIGAEVGGIPEIITEGETGFLFQKSNPEDLLRALLDAKSSGERLSAMSNRAREVFESEFTVQHMAERIERAYLTFSERRGSA